MTADQRPIQGPTVKLCVSVPSGSKSNIAQDLAIRKRHGVMSSFATAASDSIRQPAGQKDLTGPRATSYL
jgi:hypothetical protein